MHAHSSFGQEVHFESSVFSRYAYFEVYIVEKKPPYCSGKATYMVNKGCEFDPALLQT